jgi:flavin-dependent dehydrogenase
MSNSPGCAESTFDVVIIGGGPAGAASAIVLATAGRKVLLAESTGSGTFKIGEALPPAVRPLLRDLGAWDSFTRDGHLPCYGNLSAWGSPHLHDTSFIWDPNGHGWHLDRARFDDRLRETARTAGAVVRTSTILKHLARLPDGSWNVTLIAPDRETLISSGWLIDASGRRSVVARKQNIQHTHADNLVAFFALFGHSEGATLPDEDSRTLIESAPDGWWYTALTPSRQRVVAYLTDSDLAAPRELCTRKGFASLVDSTEHIRAILASHGYTIQTAPRGAAANTVCLYRFTGEGWLAVGDAALAFDPLSSQGILTSLYTGMEAGDALDKMISGDKESLIRYSSRLKTIYEAYLLNRGEYYSSEKRWSDRAFWQRRKHAG